VQFQVLLLPLALKALLGVVLGVALGLVELGVAALGIGCTGVSLGVLALLEVALPGVVLLLGVLLRVTLGVALEVSIGVLVLGKETGSCTGGHTRYVGAGGVLLGVSATRNGAESCTRCHSH
jgi:hypothetical protein